jgi:hypothetical protein
MNCDRVESKYLLSYEQLTILRGLLLKLFPVHLKYPVLSCYLDTPELEFLRQKIDGDFSHFKMRLRTYGTSFRSCKELYLEAKIKEGVTGNKRRALIDEKNMANLNWNSLFKGPSGLDEVYLLNAMRKFNLNATCNVYYEREVFEQMGEDGILRVNFDSQLIGLLPEELEICRNHLFMNRFLDERLVLMEIKRPRIELPKFLREILTNFSIKEVSYSKYSNAMLFLFNSETSLRPIR